MDRASRALVEGLPASEPMTYVALSEWSDVPRSTLYHRARGRRSKEDKAKSQQYLTPSEEKALVKYLLQLSNHGYPVRMKHLRSLAVHHSAWVLYVRPCDQASGQELAQSLRESLPRARLKNSQSGRLESLRR